MVTEPIPAGRGEANEEAPLTQNVVGLCFSVMMLSTGYQVGVSVGAAGDRDVRWFGLPDDALRAEVWRLLGRRVEVWARGGTVQRVELA
jgi:hypothetical protein